jgi:hypothetical protein
MLPTDWSAPASSVLRRLSDQRVQQYWDPNHVLATQLKNDALAPQPVQDCCVRSGILWDLAALYPPDSTWSDRMPPAVVFNGPVVDVTSEIEAALVPLTRIGFFLPPEADRSRGGTPLQQRTSDASGCERVSEELKRTADDLLRAGIVVQNVEAMVALRMIQQVEGRAVVEARPD